MFPVVAVAQTAPTATFTANGKTELTINVGDTVEYVWKGTNGTSAKTTYTVDPEACGVSGTGPFDWTGYGNTLSGSLTYPAGACSGGHTYTFFYTVTGSDGQTATATLIMHVRGVSSTGNMGTFQINGQSRALSYAYGGRTNRAEVSITDSTTGAQIAWVTSPAGYDTTNTYFQYITDPAGNKYPFITAGGHYLANTNDLASHRAVPWDTLCIFDPAYIKNPSDACGTGFKPYSATFTNATNLSGFRHDGGWIDDVNGDGWSDVHLPFLSYILTISGKTGQQLGLAHFDVAAAEEPPGIPSPFHGGRFYGGFSTFIDPNGGGRNVLFAAANPVGFFSDNNCNVSRYFAVGKWSGSTLGLKWSKYLSFGKTIFKSPYDSTANYWRLGDELNSCAHRFGNSLAYVGNHPYIVYDVFKKDNPAPECEAEVMAEQKADFTNATVSASNACRNTKGLQVTGTWTTTILDAGTGAVALTWPNVYVWGNATRVIPGGTQMFLVQQLTSNGGDVRFDQTAAAPDSFAIAKLSSGPALTIAATLSSPPSAPRVVEGNRDGIYAPGFGSSNRGDPQLVLQDIDSDGLYDIELSNGEWLGWSTSQNKLVIKSEKQTALTPTATLTANGNADLTITVGDSYTIDWESTNASSCTVAYIPTDGSASGSFSITPNAAGAGTSSVVGTYTLTCTGTYGKSVTKTVTITGVTPPTATLTANGQTDLTIDAGDSITYAWSSTNALSAKGIFTTDSDACGVGSGPIDWEFANTPAGSGKIVPGPCSAGHTYTFKYTVTGTNGQTATATLVVRVRSNTPTATLTANGLTDITITPGDTPTYVWSSTNGVSAKGTFTTDSPACGASGTGPIDWSYGNTLAGSNSYTSSTCNAGHTYYFTYTVTGKNGQTALATLTVRVRASSEVMPAATLTANGLTDITINVGDTPTYAWSANNAVSAKATYTTDSPACGASGTGPYPWAYGFGSTLHESRTYTAGPCSAGHTYYFTYTVTDSNGKTASATLTVRVNAVAAITPTATFTADGQTELTIGVGQNVYYVWKGTSGVSAKTMYTVDSEACGVAGTGPFEWSGYGNTLSGTLTYPPGPCSAGHTYTFKYTVTGSDGQTATATLIAHVRSLSAAAPFRHPLARGWTGDEVSTLQVALTKLGLYTDEITGYFGSITETAVKSLQTQNNIAAVGIVGPQTRSLLQRLLGQ